MVEPEGLPSDALILARLCLQRQGRVTICNISAGTLNPPWLAGVVRLKHGGDLTAIEEIRSQSYK